MKRLVVIATAIIFFFSCASPTLYTVDGKSATKEEYERSTGQTQETVTVTIIIQ